MLVLFSVNSPGHSWSPPDWILSAFFVSDINTDDLGEICPLGDQCKSQTLATGPVNIVQDHMADFDWLIFF